jgi:hypothetical protein
MSYEHTEKLSEPRVSVNLSVTDDAGTKPKDAATAAPQGNEDAKRNSTDSREATPATPAKPGSNERGAQDKAVSMAKVEKRSRLPALEDDGDLGVEKEHIVTRDGKADLLFMGALLASAAPASPPKGSWQEYRIYKTDGDKHVFSKVTRTVFEDQDDQFEADVYDPAPASVPSQLMRSARELARQRPMTWMDAAVAFFGYDPLAKVLYRKLSVRFEEQIS